MTIEIFLRGVGVLCCFFAAGGALAVGAYAGIKLGSWFFGPIQVSTTNTTTVRHEPQPMPNNESPEIRKQEGKDG